jgi:hypothetical protein
MARDDDAADVLRHSSRRTLPEVTFQGLLRHCSVPVPVPTPTPIRRYADTPTRRHADTPTRRHADTPTCRYADGKCRCRTVFPKLTLTLALTLKDAATKMMIFQLLLVTCVEKV